DRADQAEWQRAVDRERRAQHLWKPQMWRKRVDLRAGRATERLATRAGERRPRRVRAERWCRARVAWQRPALERALGQAIRAESAEQQEQRRTSGEQPDAATQLRRRRVVAREVVVEPDPRRQMHSRA